jgi:hypothetical protein
MKKPERIDEIWGVEIENGVALITVNVGNKTRVIEIKPGDPVDPVAALTDQLVEKFKEAIE